MIKMVDSMFHDQADCILSQVFAAEVHLPDEVFLDLLALRASGFL
jgi:hypothetical protein